MRPRSWHPVEVLAAHGPPAAWCGRGAVTFLTHPVRLKRLLTTRNSGADILQDLNYTYDPVGNIVEMTDDAQETIFFSNAQVTPDAKYEYDALYRLQSATGREMLGLAAPGNTDPAVQTPVPDATATALRLYTQSYEYDELGNIEKMIHAAISCLRIAYARRDARAEHRHQQIFGIVRLPVFAGQNINHVSTPFGTVMAFGIAIPG